MKTYGVGTKVIWDSFAGLIMGEVVKLYPTEDIDIEVTSRKNKIYREGNVVTTNRLWVFPRECFHSKPHSQSYWHEPFQWEKI